MDDSLKKDAHRMWSVIRGFRRVFLTRVHGALSGGKINLPQFNVMTLLEEHPDATMSFLADKLNVTMGAVTNLLDRLVKMGYVDRRRDPSDRRLVKAHLTDTGLNVLSEGMRNVVETLAPAMAGIELEQRRQFLDTALRLIDQIERSPRQPPTAS